MSSAILYLAIVAIWACVLIPRWLRRDSARGFAAPATAEPPVPAEAETAETEVEAEAELDEPAAELENDEIPAPVPVEPPADQERMTDSRRRMLAARRRLLLMLIGLETAALVLAATGLAALWVIAPPTVMLAGYLLLLREAAQADAERAQREAELASRARERARERDRQLRERQAAPAEDTPAEKVPTGEELAALVAKFAAAPVPADYEDSPGRDYAPGLAGKYTTSNADAEADEEYYPRLRAVGD